MITEVPGPPFHHVNSCWRMPGSFLAILIVYICLYDGAYCNNNKLILRDGREIFSSVFYYCTGC